MITQYCIKVVDSNFFGMTLWTNIAWDGIDNARVTKPSYVLWRHKRSYYASRYFYFVQKVKNIRTKNAHDIKLGNYKIFFILVQMPLYLVGY